MPVSNTTISALHEELKAQIDDAAAALKTALDAFNGTDSTTIDAQLQIINDAVAKDKQLLREGITIDVQIAERG